MIESKVESDDNLDSVNGMAPFHEVLLMSRSDNGYIKVDSRLDLSEVRETVRELAPSEAVDDSSSFTQITDHLPLTSECRSTD